MLDYNFITKHKANQLVDVSGFIYLMDQLFARAPKARALTTIKWDLQGVSTTKRRSISS